MKYQEEWGKIKECKFCKMWQQKSIFQNNESNETFYSAAFLELKKNKLLSNCKNNPNVLHGQLNLKLSA